MLKYRYLTAVLFLLQLPLSCKSSEPQHLAGGENPSAEKEIVIAAARFGEYLPVLKGKKVGVIANQTSLVNRRHLVDVLLEKGVTVVRVFAPEHGFRGEAGPGDKVVSGKDPKTGLPVVSLYGSKKRPEPSDINDLDVVLFDIQDVGVRFYTYISTLHYAMEACSENGVAVMVLDRPNPNGFYIDGPVLKKEFSSFVGVAPIPVVHGLTVGEYAMMVNGEGWLRNKTKCDLTVIKMENYHHGLSYNLPVRPSPNLPDMTSIYLYPTLCFFEGAKVSVGRGTPKPFTMMGHPDYREGNVRIVPVDIPGVITDPPYEGKECRMKDLTGEVTTIRKEKRLMVEWMIEMYGSYPRPAEFFNNFFDKLAGTDQLRKDIESGKSATDIRLSWQKELAEYKQLRTKYKLYED